MTRQDLADMPGNAGLPIIGGTLDVLSGKVYNSRERYDRYGPVSRMRAFGRQFVQIQGPDAVGEVLQNRDRAFANGPGWSFLIGPFFDRGLMLLDFDEHHRHRRIMQQAFTADRLAAYLEPMNRTLAEGLAGWPGGNGFPVYPALKQLTLDVATRTFMGAELGPEADRLNRAFAACVRAGTALVRYDLPGTRWSRGLRGRRVLEDFLRPRIPSARAGDGADLLTALCHARAEADATFTDDDATFTDDDATFTDDDATFTDDDVVNHMIFLLMAAHDTTTITMTTMAYHLARNPEWQQRCREQSQALGRAAIAYADLPELTALDQVMRECMRLVTAVPALARRTVKDTTILGRRIPADTMIAVNLQGTHHLAEYWPDPERFDPDRFAPGATVHRNSWVPFGNGVHKCIGLHFGGMQVKAAMHQVLLTHRWSVAAGYEMPVDWTSLPRPRDGLPIDLSRL